MNSQLHFRSIHSDDIPALHNLLTHPAIIPWAEHLPTREYSQTGEEFQAAQTAVHRLAGILDDRLVAYGWLRHLPRARLQHIARPGLYVHPDFWGQGIGKQLFARLLDLADNWINAWRLELHLAPGNAAARRLAEESGFELEGVLRRAIFSNGRYQDSILYTRLRPPAAAQNHPTTPPPVPSVHIVDASQVIIRPAHPDDVADVANLMRHPMVDRTTLQMPSQEIWATRTRLGEAPPPGLHRLVAEDNGRAIGLITIYQNQNPRLMHSAGLGMTVSPDYWGLGIGSRLMKAILDIADNWLDLKRVELDVNTDNPAAVGLYHKFGFEIEGTRRYHAFGDGRWADSHFMARIRE